MTARFALVLATLFATAGTSRADDLIWHTSYQNPWSSWDAYRYKSVEDQSRERIKQKSGGAVKHRSLKATDFKRAKGRAVLDEYMATSGLTGDDADNTRATLEAVIDTIETEVRKNNVATSMGVLYAAATLVVNGTEIDDATQDQLVAAINDNLAADPSFKKLKAADKQRLNDAMLVQAAVILVFSAQEDAASQEVAQTTARASLAYLTGSETGTP